MFIIIILFCLRSDRLSGIFFVTAVLISIILSSCLLLLFLYLVLFLLFPWEMIGKTLMPEFPISYSHTELTSLFCSVNAMNNFKLCAIKQILLNLIHCQWFLAADVIVCGGTA